MVGVIINLPDRTPATFGLDLILGIVFDRRIPFHYGKTVSSPLSNRIKKSFYISLVAQIRVSRDSFISIPAQGSQG